MLKNDFPIFKNRPRLVYLDSAATAQMPGVVIEAVKDFSSSHRSNVHRGIYPLSIEATDDYENARKRVKDFIHAKSEEEILFIRNTTEAINIVALSLGSSFFKKGDHILLSRAEHHSNILPWQALQEKGVTLDYVDPDENGEISLERISKKIHAETKLAAFSSISHVLGTINPVEEWSKLFREKNILFLVDAAQGVAHMPTDVQKIDCDFLVFSGHKMGASMGIGVLYGKKKLLQKMDPPIRGGGMIEEVFEDHASWAPLPQKFEAGTPNVEGAVGLGHAIEYIEKIGFDTIRKIDETHMEKTISMLQEFPEITVFGPRDVKKRGGVVSFSIRNKHPHDVAEILSRDEISLRAGHHCAMPLMNFLGVPATLRASVWVYNTSKDIEALKVGLKKVFTILK